MQNASLSAETPACQPWLCRLPASRPSSGTCLPEVWLPSVPSAAWGFGDSPSPRFSAEYTSVPCWALRAGWRPVAHCVPPQRGPTAQLPVPGTGCSAPFVQMVNYTLESTLSFPSLCHYKCPSPTHAHTLTYPISRAIAPTYTLFSQPPLQLAVTCNEILANAP